MALQITTPGRRHQLPPGVVHPAAMPPTGGRTALRQDHLPDHSLT
ncbi:hypothetical protein ACQCSU_15440 [Pseudarthrobacter sp. O4]